jgi:hypothetical protein
VALKEIGCEVVDWIHEAQDKDEWWALVNLKESDQCEGIEIDEMLTLKWILKK